MSDAERYIEELAYALSIAGFVETSFDEKLKRVLRERLLPVLEALINLRGQVQQAKDGFGVYAKSRSMDEAIRQAAAALAAVASKKENA
jgi:hypothetical protein